MAPLPTSLHSKQSSLSAPPAMVSAAAAGTLGSEAATSGEGTASRAGVATTHSRPARRREKEIAIALARSLQVRIEDPSYEGRHQIPRPKVVVGGDKMCPL